MANVGALISQTNDVIKSSNDSGNKNSADIIKLKANITQLEDAMNTDPVGLKTIQKTINNAKETIVKIQKNKVPAGPNLVKTKPDGTEVAAIVPLSSGDTPEVNGPTTPSTSRGVLENTTIDKMNNSLSHVCDFSLEVQKNNALKVFLVAQAQNIRDGVRAIMRMLGLSDATGMNQWLKDKLEGLTQDLKWIQRNIIKPIRDFEKLVVEYIKKIQEMIAWILSLPAKLLALLKDCLARLYRLIANVMTAVSDELAASDTITPDSGPSFSEVVSAAKETMTTAVQTIGQAATAAAGAMALVPLATALPSLVAPLKKGI